MDLYRNDQRILLWDLYNEPGQFGIGEQSLNFLELVWDWAFEVRPDQPLTSCMDGSIGEKIIALNSEKSDVITFHTYEADKLEPTIEELSNFKRPKAYVFIKEIPKSPTGKILRRKILAGEYELDN